MADFDPDEFLKGGTAVADPPPFDPDEFLKANEGKDFWETNPQPVTPTSDNQPLQLLTQPVGGIDTAALGAHPADPTWVASHGNINLGAIPNYVKSKLVDALNTATGSTEDADKDPEILNLRAAGNAPIVSLPKPMGQTVAAGATRGVEKTLEGLTTPENATIAAVLGGAPGIIQKAAAIGFGTMMAKDAPEKIKEALAQPTAAGKAEGLAEGISEAAMAFGSILHATGRGGRLPTGELAPTSMPEWVKQETGQEINQANPSPASIDGLLLAKEKAGERYFDLTPEKQAERNTIIKEIDDQLKGMPGDAVKAGEERVATRGQSPPPASEELPPVTSGGPPAKGGTSSLFKQAQAEVGVTPEFNPDEFLAGKEPVTTGGQAPPAEPVATENAPIAPTPPEAPTAETPAETVKFKDFDEKGKLTKDVEKPPEEAARQLRGRESVFKSLLDCLGR